MVQAQTIVNAVCSAQTIVNAMEATIANAVGFVQIIASVNF